jgi:hypothetical protein
VNDFSQALRILPLAGRASVEFSPEIVKPPKRYSLPNPPKRVKVKVQIMQRVKDGSPHLAGHEQVPEIRP